MVGEWDMHELCGNQCPECKDGCDRIIGHKDSHHWCKHDEETRDEDTYKWCLVHVADNTQGIIRCHSCGHHGLVKRNMMGTYFLCSTECLLKSKRSHKDELIRQTWPITWMKIATTIADRSYDPRLKVGAIIVTEDNTQMLSVGYNGNYKGGPHEHESDEPGKSGFIHAEINALVKCDFNTAKARHMYVTHSPCRACAKLIINSGVSRVVYGERYRDTSGLDLLRGAGVEVYSHAEAILMADEDA